MATAQHDLESETLDEEIETLKEQVATMRKTLEIESSTILSSSTALATIAKTLSSPPTRRNRRNPLDATLPDKLLDRAEQQQAYAQQCLHRIVNSVTAFKVRDPDPHAVDGGSVLGLRFEIMSKGQFLRPYYVMLNRPFPSSKHLRVHRHTVPPAIPLSGLAARHLPPPAPARENPPAQDLDHFVRALRREIIKYHNRLGATADLRRGLGLYQDVLEVLSAQSIVDVGITDVEARHVKITWADDRSGRLVMDSDGKVQKLVVMGDQGRDWTTAKELLLHIDDHFEDVAKRLVEQSLE
ncbi:hypothetical protein S40285_02469 [Stachybotrys chlorohalonatus IBT 40285]|uniref:Cenp-O kinetochore centromere component n=1 Tax=Stachybotrys chlorohalonatus (strain IBT 40285) TaxID=1283841 RepID=A0A084R0U5_STAC4|nr:hypothetical protein S40285_02469 [Stachybotrys chlorohalonata IBT 40285]